MRYNTVE